VAKYLERRGPGLHHITLRVDDIEAALAELRNRGIRLVDERPRPGAEAAMIAFIHPSAAHGVLVELKQSAQPPRSLEAKRLAWGGLELTSVHLSPGRRGDVRRRAAPAVGTGFTA
jgi:catechol 2,3-dioxygenase-like lactoylglutathione lyase family enzyme